MNVHRFRFILFWLAAGLSWAAAPARAQIHVQIQPVTAAAGSHGNSFDVTITTDYLRFLKEFSLALSVPTTDLTFMGISTGTAMPYVFAGSSIFGPDISIQPPSLPGQAILADDQSGLFPNAFKPPGAQLDARTTYGIGHVTFDVAASAPSGPIVVTIDPIHTAFAGYTPTEIQGLPHDLPTVVIDGTVTITGGTPPVPEPVQSVLMGAGLGVLWLGIGRRRRTP